MFRFNTLVTPLPVVLFVTVLYYVNSNLYVESDRKLSSKNVSFVYDVDYDQICTADKYRIIRPFIQDQWHKARKELSLSNRHINVSEHSRYIDLMYYYHTDVTIYRINSNLIGYVRLLKCGSESIHFNLLEFKNSFVNKL